MNTYKKTGGKDKHFDLQYGMFSYFSAITSPKRRFIV